MVADSSLISPAIRQRHLRRDRTWQAVVLATALATACGYDLDPCQWKPTFSATKCKPGSAVACWSFDASTVWECWAADWAPAWSLNSGSSEANAVCQTRQTLKGSGRAFFDGACTLDIPTPQPIRSFSRFPERSWELSHKFARSMVQRMDLADKRKLMVGFGWNPIEGNTTDFKWELQKYFYLGNTAPNPKFGIPSLTMQDASAGFRPYWTEIVGTVTTWPSLLALSATWDPDAVRTMAIAIGKEFRGKGANTILGPGVNVQRVARNGRNFEYLSGEDPYLGAVLATAYVKGVQSQGVLAVVKHWVMNEQETNRQTGSSDVDPKTAWELYYPPFEAAVRAGVGGVMCSYNKVHGIHSCSNKESNDILKKDMEFQGFIQSDWWATHGTVVEGLDQDMPGVDPWFSEAALKNVSHKAVDDAAERILSAMYRLDLLNTSVCNPPDCKTYFLANVTSPAHAALSRTLATQSIVLLQNENNLLPLNLTTGMKIAIIGSAAAAQSWDPAGAGQGSGTPWAIGDYYSGGGSGHMASGYVVTPMEGISARVKAAGAQVLASPTNNISDAMVVSREADVVIVVVATTSSEGKDRHSLALDDGADQLIEAIAANNSNTVVLMQIPGAVVMPWRRDAAAILALFLGGQETGHAWASVIFGDHAPTGRLPISMPETEDDQYLPNSKDHVPYAEGLATGYRNRNFKTAFKFGHGLTYTNFTYLRPNQTTCSDDQFLVCISVPIINSGTAPGRTVAQLYLEQGDESGQPTPFLKGFQWTPMLLPGGQSVVTFALNERDLSFWHEESETWVATLEAIAHIGEASHDIRHKLPLAIDIQKMWKSGWLGWRAIVAAFALCLLCGAIVWAANTYAMSDGYTLEDSDESGSSEKE